MLQGGYQSDENNSKRIRIDIIKCSDHSGQHIFNEIDCASEEEMASMLTKANLFMYLNYNSLSLDHIHKKPPVRKILKPIYYSVASKYIPIRDVNNNYN